MKIELTQSRLALHFESDEECAQYQRWVDEALQLMPKLSKLWEEEPLILSRAEFIKKQRQESLWATPSVKPLLQMGLSELVLTPNSNSQRKSGRPLDDRTIVAGMKLLCFAPYELVLKQEKAWRTEKYLSKVRDKCVVSSVKEAKRKAVRDADMCLARVKEQVKQVFKKHPEFVVRWAILYNIAREWERATNSPTN